MRSSAEMSVEQIATIVETVGERTATELHYGPVDEVELARFREKHGAAPPYEAVLAFQEQVGGVTCQMFADGAVALLQKQGVNSSRVTLLSLDETHSEPHALTMVHGVGFLEPQSGKLYKIADIDDFIEFYADMLGIPEDKLVVCAPQR